MRTIVRITGVGVTVALAVLSAGCSGGDDPPQAETLTPPVPADAAVAVAAASAEDGSVVLERCDEVASDADSLDYTGAQLGAFPDHLLTAAALDWAMTRGQYVAAWSRERHETWTIVGVTSEMAELQAELDAAFPGARVLFMNVAWTSGLLAGLANEVRSVALLPPDSVGWSMPLGYVQVTLPPGFDPASLQPFVGRRVCIA